MALIYWALELCHPFTSETDLQESFEIYGYSAQIIAFCVCVLHAMSEGTSKMKSSLIVMVLHLIASKLLFVFVYASAPIILAQSLIFFLMFFYVLSRHELRTAHTINNNNILLAFYKGNKGSVIMNVFAIIGYPVKSMCILGGEYSLKLKSTSDGFQFTKSASMISGNSDYLIVDTGVKCSEKFITKMKEYDKVKAKRIGLRIRCIEGVSDLLAMIGEEWRPTKTENAPSRYLYKALRL